MITISKLVNSVRKANRSIHKLKKQTRKLLNGCMWFDIVDKDIKYRYSFELQTPFRWAYEKRDEREDITIQQFTDALEVYTTELLMVKMEEQEAREWLLNYIKGVKK